MLSDEMKAVKAYVETALRITEDMYSNIDGVTLEAAKLYAIILALKNALVMFND